jgi:hypothetical protein
MQEIISVSNDGLEKMVLDPQILQGAHQVGGGHRRSVEVIEHAYCTNKRRAHYALQDWRQKSFGLREEHRVSWSLLQGLLARLCLKSHEDLEILLLDCPSYAWPVKTEVWTSSVASSLKSWTTMGTTLSTAPDRSV